jgi:hypothetical protein
MLREFMESVTLFAEPAAPGGLLTGVVRPGWMGNKLVRRRPNCKLIPRESSHLSRLSSFRALAPIEITEVRSHGDFTTQACPKQ